MEVKKKRTYSKEFKEDVLNMIKTGEKNIREIARELGIAEQVIYNRYRKSRYQEGPEGKLSN